MPLKRMLRTLRLPQEKMFDRLIWHDDRVLLDDIVFRLQHHRNDHWELGEQCFLFYKTKYLVDQYAAFLAMKPAFKPECILELGIFDGGSTAFWYECFSPKKCIAIDIQDKSNSSYFDDYIRRRSAEDAIKTHWGISQEDSGALRSVVEHECGGSLDLVIDDASHHYVPTKASFETLFPLVRPGGLYIIEDWAWGHWQHFQPPRPEYWTKDRELTRLVVELVEAVGTEGSTRLIGSLAVFQGFAVIERGHEGGSIGNDFKLDSHIFRRPDAAA